MASAHYRFPATAYADIRSCLDEHGFAIVESVIDDGLVDTLRRATDEACEPMGRHNDAWSSQTCLAFIEGSAESLALLRCQGYRNLEEQVLETKDLTIHRSACIRRRTGPQVVSWHTDASSQMGGVSPLASDDVLNQRKSYRAHSAWFYLTGSRPRHGGLYVIPASHRSDWQPPAGFRLVMNGKSFNRIDGPEEPYRAFDVPGALAVETCPGDCILFDIGTYHAAQANQESETRLSCAIGFRPRADRIVAPWPLPASAHAMHGWWPEDLRDLLDGYTSMPSG